jgi:hypothetical protein
VAVNSASSFGCSNDKGPSIAEAASDGTVMGSMFRKIIFISSFGQYDLSE